MFRLYSFNHLFNGIIQYNNLKLTVMFNFGDGYMKLIKKLFCVFIICAFFVGTLSSCGRNFESKIPQYPQAQFEIGALSSPKEISEESFEQYKKAGLNVFIFSIHNGKVSSEDLYYLGSKRTQKALELCKKMGMDVYVAYGNSWASRSVEGEDYFGDTPFSKHNYYSEYMDMIKGIRIIDEPNKEKITELADETLINDFKKIYPDKKYMINLIPKTAGSHNYGYDTYEELVNDYAEKIMAQFDTSYISLDFYPFNTLAIEPDHQILSNYQLIANTAKKYNAEKTFILQSSVGVEFEESLNEGDMRWQVYTALAFGADNLQYYCYSVPAGREYNYCMLMPDNKTPSDVYYYVQEINNEIQGMASAVLSYEWDKTIGISGSEEMSLRVSSLEYDENLEKAKFHNAKYFENATSTHDLIVSRFISEEYGESYMIVNFAEREKSNAVNAQFKDCGAVAIYGGKGFDGTPRIVELADDGTLALNLQYGEGVFIVPIK